MLLKKNIMPLSTIYIWRIHIKLENVKSGPSEAVRHGGGRRTKNLQGEREQAWKSRKERKKERKKERRRKREREKKGKKVRGEQRGKNVLWEWNIPLETIKNYKTWDTEKGEREKVREKNPGEKTHMQTLSHLLTNHNNNLGPKEKSHSL